MITILTTTENLATVENIIGSVDRLHELVDIGTKDLVQSGNKVLLLGDGFITSPIDWFDTEPPYRIPPIQFSETNLLAMVFDKLGNHQKAFQLLTEEDTLYPHLLGATNLRFGYEFNEDLIHSIQHSAHNKAIVCHYGILEKQLSFNELREHYAIAIKESSDSELLSYTVKHYLNLLIDGGLFEEAVEIANSYLKKAVSPEAELALNIQLSTARFKNLSMPYSHKELESLLELQEACISSLEVKDLHINAALLSMDACDVSNFLGDFQKAKDYINKSISCFKDYEITEFIGEAGLKKAHLLYHWSKSGNPQYYKSAINAFQDTLKIFKKDLYPEHFAEVQHNLALIYSEIPAPEDEKAIWTAFSASAFKEALTIYTRESHPYDHAMVCHNYATALMDFPPAKLHNNFEKAQELFEVALEIRTAQRYPMERALTLLNQLELGWLLHNSDSGEESRRYSEMTRKAEEIKSLVSSEDLLDKVNSHLHRLEKLRTVI